MLKQLFASGTVITGEYSPRLRLAEYLSFIDPERGGFGVIYPEVMIFSEGLCPEENIITDRGKYYAESPERWVYKLYIIPNRG